MAFKGQIIHNPRTGEFVEFLETAVETNGAYSRIRIKVKAGGFKPVLHLHTSTDETFDVISGELTCIVNRETKRIGPGEKILLQKGIPHTHYNGGQEDLLMVQTFAPSQDAEIFLENLFGLDAEGKLPNGKPAFLQLMVWARSLKAKSYIASVPVRLQNVMAFLLAPLGRLLGYKAAYKRFSGFDA